MKHEAGWEGSPAKLARATCLAGPDWSQGLIAHVWGGKDNVLCIESHVTLNTPGARDGVFELWVDGKMEAARTDLDWHGGWSEYGITFRY